MNDNLEAIVDDDQWHVSDDGDAVLIPEGFYHVSIVDYEYRTYQFGPKAVFTCEVIVGEFAGTRLQRWIPVVRKQHGYTAPGPQSDYRRTMKALSGDGRSSPKAILGIRARARIETVRNRHSRGESVSLPAEHHWSKIADLLPMRESR